MNTYPRVYLTYHADGNVGIGTPPDASVPLVMGEPVVEGLAFLVAPAANIEVLLQVITVLHMAQEQLVVEQMMAVLEQPEQQVAV